VSDPGIPLSDLDYDAAEEAAVLRVLRSKWISTGPEAKQFEAEVAALLGVRHAVAVANGTAALHLALLALGIGRGDEVIQPAINFVAAANVTRATGATPVLADIVGLAEPVLDPADVERRITPRTRAVVIMHYGGYATRLVEIARLCRARGIALVEDACHAIGGRAGGGADAPMAGSLGDLACFSFFSNKNLAIGEGGMVTTDRADLLATVTRLRSHGMTSLSWDRHRGHASSYDVVVNGYNYRMDDLRAALGRTQLAKLARNNERRRALVAAYRARLRQVPGLILPFAEAEVAASACHLMTLVAPGAAAREAIAEALRARGIQTSRHYPCITGFSAFAEVADNSLPHSLDFAARTLTLPLFPTMTIDQLDQVCDAVAVALRQTLAA
jgi:dTDP-4-amino-4,6-dideoxygalactose transaminase